MKSDSQGCWHDVGEAGVTSAVTCGPEEQRTTAVGHALGGCRSSLNPSPGVLLEH